MKTLIKKLIFFFMVFAAGTIISCDGGSSGDSPIDVSGTYNVTTTVDSVSSGTDVWILKQTGNDVAVLFGEGGPMTVSGSNLIIAWEWDEEGVPCSIYAELAINGNKISGTGTMSSGESGTIGFDMTRISTSSVVPEFNIPEASITVGVAVNDWDSVATYVTDATGDATGGTGTDIQSVKIARDSSNVYILIKTNGLLSTDYEYELDIHDTSYQEVGGIGFGWNSSWQVSGTSGQIYVITDYIELSFPYSGMFTPGQKYIIEQRFHLKGGMDLVDEADFTGYTILPVL